MIGGIATTLGRFKSTYNSRIPISGQSYKAITIAIYESRVINMRHLLVTMTLES